MRPRQVPRLTSCGSGSENLTKRDHVHSCLSRLLPGGKAAGEDPDPADHRHWQRPGRHPGAARPPCLQPVAGGGADVHRYMHDALSNSLKNCVFNGGARPPPCLLVAGGGGRHHWRGHREQGEGGHQVFEIYQLVITIVFIIIAIVIIVIVLLLLLLLLLYCYCIVIVIVIVVVLLLYCYCYCHREKGEGGRQVFHTWHMYI